MRNSKSILLSLSLMVIFAVSSFANPSYTTGNDGNPAVFVKQIQKSLKDVDLLKLGEKVTILMKFTINDNDELVVLNTNDSEFDKRIKAKLNYLKVENHGFETEKVYTIPLTFQSK